jgi:hypothetical protein
VTDRAITEPCLRFSAQAVSISSPLGGPGRWGSQHTVRAHALGELEVRSERPVVPGAQDRGQYLFLVGEVLEEVPGQFVETGDEQRPDGGIVRPA